MEGRGQDVTDAQEPQVFSEGLRDKARPIVREQLRAMIPGNISHACEVDRILDHLDERVCCHVSLEPPGEDEP